MPDLTGVALNGPCQIHPLRLRLRTSSGRGGVGGTSPPAPPLSKGRGGEAGPQGKSTDCRAPALLKKEKNTVRQSHEVLPQTRLLLQSHEVGRTPYERRPSRVTGPLLYPPFRYSKRAECSYLLSSGCRARCEGAAELFDASFVGPERLTDPAASAAPEAIAEPPPARFESNICVPPSRRTLRVDDVITEPSALPAEDEATSRPLIPNTPWLPEVSIPLAFNPPTAPAE